MPPECPLPERPPRHGSGGFGYDPVFVPDLYPNLTMAELSEDAKNAISHRGVALRLMTTWLAKY